MLESRRRDIAPDVLRGFALLGILFVNIPYMALNSEYGAYGDDVQGFANSVAAFMMFAFFQGKFYILFSFLFGYSANYIVKNEKSLRGRWIKRCITLMGIGAVHGAVIWHGEIVFVYGLYGLVLLPFLFRAEHTLKIWSTAIFMILSVVFVGVALLVLGMEVYIPNQVTEDLLTSQTALALDRALQQGLMSEVIVARSALWLETLWSLVGIQGGLAFAAFLLGLRASWQQFLSDTMNHQRIVPMIRWGFGLGLPIQLGIAAVWLRNAQSPLPSEGVYLLTTSLSFATAPLLTMGYIGFILSIVKKKPSWVSWIQPAGKMSLTLYIAQSVITSVLFTPWGFGLFQQVQLWQLAVIAIAIWIIQVNVSVVWLRRFRFGPLEWCVNMMTNKPRMNVPSQTS
jgi:uncharacterized protein